MNVSLSGKTLYCTCIWFCKFEACAYTHILIVWLRRELSSAYIYVHMPICPRCSLKGEVRHRQSIAPVSFGTRGRRVGGRALTSLSSPRCCFHWTPALFVSCLEPLPALLTSFPPQAHSQSRVLPNLQSFSTRAKFSRPSPAQVSTKDFRKAISARHPIRWTSKLRLSTCTSHRIIC